MPLPRGVVEISVAVLLLIFGPAAGAASEPATAGHVHGGPGWQVRNNTNLRFGDLPELDFSLPPGTDDAAAVAACTAFCTKHSECAAWVMVRTGPRCAIKGRETGWCGPVADAGTVSGIKPGVVAAACPRPAPPPGPPLPPPPGE